MLLNQLTVLVTRPTMQAKSLCEAITLQGAKAVHIPAIDIVPLHDAKAFAKAFAALKTAKFACFVSANAVWHSLPAIKMVLNKEIQCIAVGPTTAKVLAEYGIENILHPEKQYSSEGVLALSELQKLEGESVVLFCGESGREFLAEALRDRGASVTEITVYRRIKPDIDNDSLNHLWQDNDIDVVVSTSREGLYNLCQMLPNNLQQTLYKTPLLVISERMAPIAKKLGFIHSPIVAENATDEGIIKALQGWYS